MTQTEIITEILRETQKARMQWEQDQTKYSLQKWDKHLACIEIITKILDKNTQKEVTSIN